MIDIKQLKKDWNDFKLLDFLIYDQKITPIAVFITGSRLNQTATQNSDIDIVIFVKEEQSIKDIPYRINYHGITIHGWIRSFVYNLKDISAEFSFGMIFDGLLREEYCLWLNPEYSNLFQFFKKYQKDMCRIGLYLSLEKEKDIILIMTETHQFLGSKVWYAIIYGSCLIENKAIPFDLLKHIKERTLSDIEKSLIVQSITQIWSNYKKDQNFSQLFIKILEIQRKYLEKHII